MPKIPASLGGRFRVMQKIGGGGFGLVFEAKDMQTGDIVAVKVEFSSNNCHALLQYEARICEGFSRLSRAGKLEKHEVGFPIFYQCGTQGTITYIAMEKLGPNLDTLLKFCRPTLSLKTVLIIAEQMLARVERFHSKGLVHRDIKPHNFAMGWGKNGACCYLIDFGLAARFCNSDHEHIHFATGKGLIGTPWFCSINAHDGNELSRRDDLESLFYVFVYLLRGSLPWQRVRVSSQDEQNALIREQKVGPPIKNLLRELPPEFVSFYNYVRSLGFKKKPNYQQMQKLFERLFQKKGYTRDDVYDWTEKWQVTKAEKAAEEARKQRSSSPQLSTLVSTNGPTTGGGTTAGTGVGGGGGAGPGGRSVGTGVPHGARSTADPMSPTSPGNNARPISQRGVAKRGGDVASNGTNRSHSHLSVASTLASMQAPMLRSSHIVGNGSSWGSLRSVGSVMSTASACSLNSEGGGEGDGQGGTPDGSQSGGAAGRYGKQGRTMRKQGPRVKATTNPNDPSMSTNSNAPPLPSPANITHAASPTTSSPSTAPKNPLNTPDKKVDKNQSAFPFDSLV